MKKRVFFLSAILFGIYAITWYSCETDPEEVCEQENNICAEQTEPVTYCCSEGDCYYQFNGQNYTDNELDQLAEDLGCAVAIVLLKSGEEVKDYSEVIAKLEALRARVLTKVNSKK